MAALKKRYGAKKGKSIYYAMENEGKLKKAKRTVARRKKKRKRK